MVYATSENHQRVLTVEIPVRFVSLLPFSGVHDTFVHVYPPLRARRIRPGEARGGPGKPWNAAKAAWHAAGIRHGTLPFE